ncbi:MAG: membrane protein insertion efficiency factor YidD [Planctomycetaceae bacterium]
MFFRRGVVLFLVWGFLTPLGVQAGEGRWDEPWPKQGTAPSGLKESPASPLSPGQRAAQGVMRFFQSYISPVDGDRCPSYPTCSQYSVEAIRKHGVWIGLVMTFDRLIHESDEIGQAPRVKIYGSYRTYDPVENNDFWWNKGSRQHSAFSGQRKNSFQRSDIREKRERP